MHRGKPTREGYSLDNRGKTTLVLFEGGDGGGGAGGLKLVVRIQYLSSFRFSLNPVGLLFYDVMLV